MADGLDVPYAVSGTLDAAHTGASISQWNRVHWRRRNLAPVLNGPTEDPIRVSYDDIQKSQLKERKERIAARRAAAVRRFAERG